MKMDSFLLILYCAIITYSLRFGGLLLSRRLPEKGRVKRALNILPAAILISYVTPGIGNSGYLGIIAAIVIVIMTKLTGKVLLSTATGIATLSLCNYLF